jgi:hypothetical protein
MSKQHYAVTKYSIAIDKDKGQAPHYTVVYMGRENVSHHETLSEARAAVARYEAADTRLDRKE